MIKKGFFDFLKCLKYYFVPLGILSVFTVVGLSIGVTGINNAIRHFFEEVARIVSAARIDWEGIWGAFMGEIGKLNFSENFNKAISTMFSSEWLSNTLNTVAKAVFGDTVNFDEIAELVSSTIASVVTYVITFFVMILVGIVTGIFAVKLLLRKELTRVKVGKLVLFTLIDTLFWLVLIILFNVLSSIVSWIGIILIVLVVLGFMFICLIEAYLFYARKKIPFKKVVNIKNVLKLYVIELMVFAITTSISVLFIVLFKFFIGFYIALPIIEIGIIANSLEAENYVVNMVDEVNQPSDFILRGNYEKKI